MTSYELPAKPDNGTFNGFFCCEFWVSNAKQAAYFYCTTFGFNVVAYRGLETGTRDRVTWVVQQNDIRFAFTSSLEPKDSQIGREVMLHGDGVKDVMFDVDDCKNIFKEAVAAGAVVVQEPKKLEDEDGYVWVASLQTYGDTIHTLVERTNYKGQFLPGYPSKTLSFGNVESPCLDYIDHVVGNQPDGKMVEVANWYENCLKFHRFWSVDDKQIHTKYSSLRSIVMASHNRKIKMPINEPAQGMKKSQIQEYVDFYGGAGVQHIALNTKDVIKAVTNLTARGVDFLRVPDTYYEKLRERLAGAPITVKEDLNLLQKLGLLVDFDDRGYLLQIFTKPVEDRPTLFFEIIQRAGCEGFGAGNFKSLFESIEIEQAKRGNL